MNDKEKDINQSDKFIKKERPNESLFSEREKRDIVRGFISSYIEGKVTIDLPTSETGIDIHKRLLDLINTCFDEKSATPAQLNEAISDLFSIIIIARSTKTLKGEFTKSSVEERLQKLEEGLEITNDLVKQFIDWFQSGLSK